MKVFIPRVDRSQFKERILSIQDQEGNNSRVVSIVRSKLAGYSGLYFFEAFLSVCSEYRIDYVGSMTIESNHRVDIRLSGNIYSSISYTDQDRDISSELAEGLYQILSIQIKNQLFVDEVKEQD